jgi:MoxR-like ATPase
MWWAINWGDAEEHLEKHGKHCKTFAQRPDKELDKQDGGKLVQKDSAKKNGCVLLLDEIDKADSELPNSLLEVLANTGFRLPWDGDHEIKSEGVKPLIIITTNEDRELPAAFLRRCLVLMLEAEGEFKAWIKERARVHFRDPDQPAADEEDTRPAISNAVLDRAAELLQDNPQASAADNHKPGLAEYLDLLRGLHKLAENDEAIQLGWLARVSGFAYNKNAAPKH